MKKEILMFITGVLIGAIITTGVFLVLNNNKSIKKFDGFDGQRPQFSENRNENRNDNRKMIKPDENNDKTNINNPTESPENNNSNNSNS